MCDSCENDNNYNNPILQLCKTCSKMDSNKLITKTDAIKKYALNKKDLDNIRCKSYMNQYKTESYLFLIKDVKTIAINKYGTEEKLNEKINYLNKRRESKQNRKNNQMIENRNNLNKHLKQIGLGGIRNDSTLCENYIEKGEDSGFTVEEIGKILLEMRFYYNYTNYNDLLKKYRHDERYEFWHWDADDEESIRIRAKSDAIMEYTRINFKNPHKMISEVPLSLQYKLNKCIKQIDKENKKIKGDQLIKRYEKNMKDFEERNKLYKFKIIT